MTVSKLQSESQVATSKLPGMVAAEEAAVDRLDNLLRVLLAADPASSLVRARAIKRSANRRKTSLAAPGSPARSFRL